MEAWCTEQRQASAREKRAALKQVAAPSGTTFRLDDTSVLCCFSRGTCCRWSDGGFVVSMRRLGRW